MVWAAAVAAALARFPGALWPVRPDEAGFTLVARSWHPEPDAMFGRYFVDRPPSLIAFVKLSDAIGGPTFLRLIAALGCGLLVLAAAAIARAIARYVAAEEATSRRAAAWTAVVTAAVTTNAMIDPVAAKGEILGIPLVVGSFWLTLRAVERRSAAYAFHAGLVAALALGLKQNMADGFVFCAVVLIGETVRRTLRVGEFARLTAAAFSGAAIPVLGTIGWALWAGVKLETLWYAVYGFRSDAIATLASQPSDAPRERAWQLAVAFVATGMVFIVAWFLPRLPGLVRPAPVLVSATLAVGTLEAVGLVLGGSYWAAYLFGLVPVLVLALALVLAIPGHGRSSKMGAASVRAAPRVVRGVLGLVVVSTVFSLTVWVVDLAQNNHPPTEVNTGQALARAARPRDTMVIYGGRADIQLTSGMASPYEHLWSLPMRTLDPRAKRLRRLLEGRRAPTWFVEWVPLGTWDPVIETNLRDVLDRRYVRHGTTCSGYPIYLLKGLHRRVLRQDCVHSHLPWATPGQSEQNQAELPGDQPRLDPTSPPGARRRSW